MEAVQTDVVGRGNKIRTVFYNILNICLYLDKDLFKFAKALGKQLKVRSKFDEDCICTLNGAFTSEYINRNIVMMEIKGVTDILPLIGAFFDEDD